MDIFEVVVLIRNKRPRKFPPGGVVGDGGGSCEGKTLKKVIFINSLKLRT